MHVKRKDDDDVDRGDKGLVAGALEKCRASLRPLQIYPARTFKCSSGPELPIKMGRTFFGQELEAHVTNLKDRTSQRGGVRRGHRPSPLLAKFRISVRRNGRLTRHAGGAGGDLGNVDTSRFSSASFVGVHFFQLGPPNAL